MYCLIRLRSVSALLSFGLFAWVWQTFTPVYIFKCACWKIILQNNTFSQFCKAHCIKQSAKTNHTKHISQIIVHYARKLHKPNWTELIAKNRVKRTITHTKLHKVSWSTHFVKSNLYKHHLIALHTNKLDLMAYTFAKVNIMAQFQNPFRKRNPTRLVVEGFPQA